jgi:hypothetical protein
MTVVYHCVQLLVFDMVCLAKFFCFCFFPNWHQMTVLQISASQVSRITCVNTSTWLGLFSFFSCREV